MTPEQWQKKIISNVMIIQIVIAIVAFISLAALALGLFSFVGGLSVSGGQMEGELDMGSKAILNAQRLAVSGTNGASEVSQYVGATTNGPPTTGTFSAGDFVIDVSGNLWICSTAGTPGKWTAVSAYNSSQTPPMLSVAGNNQNAVYPSRYLGITDGTSPKSESGQYSVGDYALDLTGDIWICVDTQTPVAWKSIRNTLGFTSAPQPQFITSDVTTGSLTVSGIPGAQVNSRYAGGSISGPPETGIYDPGDFVVDLSGDMWVYNSSFQWVSVGAAGSYLALVGGKMNGSILCSAGVDLGSSSQSFANLYATNVVGSLISGTLQTANQPNLTTLGTLTNLDVQGIMTVASGIHPIGVVDIGTLSQPFVNVFAQNIEATQLSGTLLTSSQPNVLSVGGTIGLTLQGPLHLGGSNITQGGEIDASVFGCSGITGALTASRYVGGTTNGSPLSGTFQAGDFVVDVMGNIWIYTTGHTWQGLNASGTYLPLAGGAMTGTLACSGTVDIGTSAQAFHTVYASNLVGVLQTAQQPYVTLVGTLSGLNLGGTLNMGDNGITQASDISSAYFHSTGITGASATSRYVGGTASGAPVSGTFLAGDMVIDHSGNIWVFTTNNQWQGINAAGTYLPLAGGTMTGNFLCSGSVDIGSAVQSFNHVYVTNVIATQLTGTLQTASQPNVTQVGVLFGLTLQGDLAMGGYSITSATEVTAQALVASGITGVTAGSRYVGATTSGAPVSGTFQAGDLVIDQSGNVWIYTTGHTWQGLNAAGTYVPLAGGTLTGSLLVNPSSIVNLGSGTNTLATVYATNLYGTLQQASQPSITALPSLTNLNGIAISSGSIGAFTLTGSIAMNASNLSIGTNVQPVNTIYATTLTSTNVSGTLQTASQPNVTSVGALTSLSMAGDINLQGHNITQGLSVSSTTLSSSGVTGATSSSRYVGGTTSGAPVSGVFQAGDFVIDQSGNVWVYTSGSSWQGLNASGTYVPLAGGTMSGDLLISGSHNLGSSSTPWQQVYATSLTGTLTTPVQTAITQVGTLSVGTWQASTVAVSYGGTGQTSLPANQLLFGNSTSGVGSVPSGPTGSVLIGVSGSNPVFSTTPTVSSITISNTPVNTTDGANKAYVDSVVAGLTWKDTCVCASTSNLSATYNNGSSGVGATLTNSGTLAVFTVDGQSPVVNSRILVLSQTSSFQNGIYVLTTVGSASVAWVLTRATDWNQPSQIQPGDIIPVQLGVTNGGTSWLQTATVTSVGTSAIVFSQFSYSASTFLQVNNNLSELTSSALTARTNLGVTNLATQSVTAGQVLIGAAGNALTGPTLTNGQLLIGSTGATPVAAVPLNGTNISWSTGVGSLTANLTGQVAVSNGGTGLASMTPYAVLVGGTSSTSALQSLASVGASGQVLTSQGASALPQWVSPCVGTVTSITAGSNLTGGTITTSGTIALSSTLSGVTWNGQSIGLGYGGTGTALTASNGGIVYSTGSAMAILSGTASAYSLLLSGASSAPSWLAPSVSTMLITSAGGVPSWSSTLPAFTMGGDIIPATTNTYNLGSATFTVAAGYFNSLFVASTTTNSLIYVDVSKSVQSVTIGNGVTFSGGSLTANIDGSNLIFSSQSITTAQSILTTASPTFAALSLVSGSYSVKLNVGTGSTAYNFNLPTSAGSSGALLTSAGGGNTPMTWTNISSIAASSITGTANQVLVNGGYGSATVGAITLTLPQSISTSSSPTFVGLTLSGLAYQTILYNSSGVVSTVNIGSNLTFASGTLSTISSPSFSGLTLTSASGVSLLYSNSGVVSTATCSSPLSFSAGTLSISANPTFTTINGLPLNNIVSFSGASSNTWYEIASLPADNNSNFALIHFVVSLSANWGSPQNTYLNVHIANRGGFYYEFSASGSTIYATTTVQVYKQADGSIKIYAYLTGSNFNSVAWSVLESIQVTYDGTSTTTTPSGTLVFDASVNQPTLQQYLNTTSSPTSSGTASVVVNGGLGVGAAPDSRYMLDVTQNMRIGSSSSSYGYLTIGSSTIQNNMIELYPGSSGISATNVYGFGINSGTLRYNSQSNHQWFSNTIALALLNSSGQLGLNDSNPRSYLSVVGNAQIGFTSGTTAPSNGMAVSGLVYIGTSVGLGNADQLQVVGTMSVGATGNSTTGVMRITSGSGTSYIESGLTLTGGSAATLHFTDMYASNKWMTIGSTGKIGINDAAPGAYLSIVGNAQIGFTSGTSAPTGGLIVSGNTAIGASTPSSRFSVGAYTPYDLSTNYSSTAAFTTCGSDVNLVLGGYANGSNSSVIQVRAIGNPTYIGPVNYALQINPLGGLVSIGMNGALQVTHDAATYYSITAAGWATGGTATITFNSSSGTNPYVIGDVILITDVGLNNSVIGNQNNYNGIKTVTAVGGSVNAWTISFFNSGTLVNVSPATGYICKMPTVQTIYHMLDNGAAYMGVSTHNPQSFLHINGVTSTTSNYGIFTADAGANVSGRGGSGLTIGYNSTNNWVWMYGRTDGVAGRPIVFGIDGGSGNGAVMYVNNYNGNTGLVGINDVTPGASLSVVGNAQIGFVAGTASSANGLVVNGNTGIGTSTPSSLFHVQQTLGLSSATSNPVVAQQIIGSGTSRMYLGQYYQVGVNAYSSIQCSDYYSNSDHYQGLMLNPNGGNIGVGLTGPQSLLHLHNVGDGVNPSDVRILLTDASTGNSNNTSGLAIMKFSNNHGYIYNYTTGYNLCLGTNGSERLTIAASGNVGISNTAPSYLLDVAGTIRSTSSLLTAGNVLVGYAASNNTNPRVMIQASDANTCAFNFDITGTGTGASYRCYAESRGTSSPGTVNFWNGDPNTGNVTFPYLLAASNLSVTSSSTLSTVNGVTLNTNVLNPYPGANTWYPIAQLPADNGSNHACIHFVISLSPNYYSNSFSYLDIKFANRGGMTYEFTVGGSSNVTSGTTVQAYKQTDGSLYIWAYLAGSTFNSASWTILDAQQATYTLSQTTSPTGTVVFDASSYTPTIQRYGSNTSTPGSMIVNSNLGMSVATPQSKIHINGSASGSADFGLLTVETGSNSLGNNGQGLTMGFDTTNLWSWIYSRSVGLYARPIVLNNGVLFTTSYVTGTGLVGVGTTNPAAHGAGTLTVNHTSGGKCAIQMTTSDVDTYPVVQLLAYGHDNTGLNFDAYYDTVAGDCASTSTHYGWRIFKNSEKLNILSYPPGASAGATVSATYQASFSTTGLGLLDTSPACRLSVVGNAQIGFNAGTGAPSDGLVVAGQCSFGAAAVSGTFFNVQSPGGFSTGTYLNSTINVADQYSEYFGLNMNNAYRPTATGNVYNICDQPNLILTSALTNFYHQYTRAFLTTYSGGVNYTLSNYYGHFINAPSVDVPGNITYGYGLYVSAPGAGATSQCAIYGDNMAIGYHGFTPPTNGMIVQGNVGLGISSSSTPLDVRVATAGAGNAIAAFGGATTVQRIILYDENTSTVVGPKIYFAAGNNAQIAGASHICLMPNSNVGINTTVPSYTLDVSGSFHTTGTYTNTGGNITLQGGNYVLFGAGGGAFDYTGSILYDVVGGNQLKITSTGDAAYSTTPLGTRGGDMLFVNQNNSGSGGSVVSINTMFLSRYGNVGIGTTSPASLLELYQTLPISDVTSNPMAAQQIIGNNSGRMYIGNFYTAGVATYGAIQCSDSYVDGTGLFKDHYQNLSLNPNGGAVGIGITTPSSLLHLNANYASTDVRIQLTDTTTGSSTNSLGVAIIKDSNQTAYFWNYSNTPMYFGTNNTTRIAVTASGFVGIGTSTSLSSNLHVNGSSGYITTMTQTTDATSYAANILSNDGASSCYLFLNGSTRSADGGANCTTLRNDAGDLRLQSKGGNGIFIQNTTGCVGIGTATFTNNTFCYIYATQGAIAQLVGGTLTQTCSQISGIDCIGVDIQPILKPTFATGSNCYAVSQYIYPSFDASAAASTTIALSAGIYIGSGNFATGGTITQAYGLFVDEPTFGSSHYAACFNGKVLFLASSWLYNSALYLRAYSDANHGIQYDSTVDGPMFMGYTGFRWNNGTSGATELMRLNSTGLGIGCSPSCKLDIHNDGNSNNWNIVKITNSNSGSSAVSGMVITAGSVLQGGQLFAFSSTANTDPNSFSIFNYPAAAIRMGVNNAENMRIDWNGNVGVHTLAPATQFQVGGVSAAISFACYLGHNPTTNQAFGYGALSGISTGFYNTALGYNAGTVISTGQYNLFLGYYANANSDLTNCIVIGANTTATTGNSCFIANVYGTTLPAGNDLIGVTSGNQLGLVDFQPHIQSVYIASTSTNTGTPEYTGYNVWTTLLFLGALVTSDPLGQFNPNGTVTFNRPGKYRITVSVQVYSDTGTTPQCLILKLVKSTNCISPDTQATQAMQTGQSGTRRCCVVLDTVVNVTVANETLYVQIYNDGNYSIEVANSTLMVVRVA